MAKCDLNIVLDRPDRSYKAGERVIGKVEVTACHDCECRKLSVSLEWRTSGKSNTDSGEQHSLELFKGSWRAGQQTAYPFKFTAPAHPLTYHGKLFNVDWHLRARADIPGALDPKVDEQIVLVAGGVPFEPDEEEVPQEEILAFEKSIEIPIAPKIIFGLGVGFLLLGFFILWHLRKTVHGPSLRESQIWLFLGATGCLLTGSGALWHGSRHLMLARRLGPVDAKISPEDAHPGGNISCSIRFRPRAELFLTEATLRLVAEEKIVKGSGKNRRTVREVVHQETISLASARRIAMDEGAVLQGAVRLPPDAPCTFFALSNELTWRIEAALNLKRWPDWKRDFSFDVRP